MKNKSNALLAIIICLIIIFSIFIIIQRNTIIRLEYFNYILKKNISKETIKDNVTILLDVTSNSIFRIGVYSDKHYEITEFEEMEKITNLLNSLSFDKTEDISNINSLYTISFYTIFDRKLFSFSIISSNTIKIGETFYKCNNGFINIQEIENILK